LAANQSFIRFQNNIQSIFTRVRLLYGSTPLEDIVNYNVIARMLSEWTSSSGAVHDQTSIADGIGGASNIGSSSAATKVVNTRSLTHGLYSLGAGFFCYPSAITASGYTTRRYQVTIGLGLFTQGKLLPTKFMASQLAVELTLAKETDCIISNGCAGISSALNETLNPTYQIKNVNMIPEILEFDASYDNMFLKGLQEGGVPIKFSSWHTYQFTHPGGNSVNILIQERSRSVKSIFTVIRRQNSTKYNDSGALFAHLKEGNYLESYQYRIGGRYFPASPVQVNDGGIDIGSAEAFLELQKALHTVGDSRLSTNASSLNWAPRYVVPTGINSPNGASAVRFQTVAESDYQCFPSGADSANVQVYTLDGQDFTTGGPGAAGIPSACFCMATCLESTSGMEISGLNAEEQSDISLNIKWTGAAPDAGAFLIETYVFYDAMIVLRENNVLELIQ
jgi:hypothetical protein